MEPTGDDGEFCLDRTTAAVLRQLARHKAALQQCQLSNLTEISGPTVRKAVRRLTAAHMIALPFGGRSGYVLTPAGKRLWASISPETLKLLGLCD